MQAKSTRIAYLKRMLQRLETQHARLDDLVRAGELTAEASELGARQLANEREQLLAELRGLQGDDVPHGNPETDGT